MPHRTQAITIHLPRWLRMVFVGCLVLCATGAGLYVYRLLTLPVTLSVAAGSLDGEATRLMTSLAGRLTSNKADVRLKVVDTASALQAAREFAAGNVDLALVRADSKDLADARTIVRAAHGVVMLLVSAGSRVESMDQLRNTMVGVLGGEINNRVTELITQEYDLVRARVRFRELALEDAAEALRARQVGAILAVVPISQRYLTQLRGLFPANSGKNTMRLIALDAAGAIAAIEQAYESYDLPKGTLRGSPPIPDDDLTTLRVPYFLVARKTLNEDTAGNLASALMTARGQLMSEYPLVTQMSKPDTDKDAFIPVHPGAAAYFDGTRAEFFDKYANALLFGPMLFGGLASIVAALSKFIGPGVGHDFAAQLREVDGLADRIRSAGDETELAAAETELDAWLQHTVADLAPEDRNTPQLVALNMVAQRIEGLIRRRRDQLEAPGRARADASVQPLHARKPSSPA